MQFTQLKLTDELALTCTRKGTCCHGNLVHLNPWELATMAQHKKMSVSAFRNEFTENGGMLLKFNGQKDFRGKAACNQYTENFGCSIHEGRPLACRLFPIARQIQNEQVSYVYQGSTFPCLNGCTEVNELSNRKVQDYLSEQNTSEFEQAQDAYLEIMQNLADIALMLLLDTELVNEDAKSTLMDWKQIGNESAHELQTKIGSKWMDELMTPNLSFTNAIAFSNAHNEHLQNLAQTQIDQIKDIQQLKETSKLFIRMALYLAKAIGADASALCALWIEIAKENGAEN
jgi:Fe-S-cluster containining protein